MRSPAFSPRCSSRQGHELIQTLQYFLPLQPANGRDQRACLIERQKRDIRYLVQAANLKMFGRVDLQSTHGDSVSQLSWDLRVKKLLRLQVISVPSRPEMHQDEPMTVHKLPKRSVC